MEDAHPRPSGGAFPRGWLGVTSAGLFALFCVLALEVRLSRGPLSVDTGATRVVRDSLDGISGGRARAAARLLVPLGAPVPALVLIAALAVTARRRRDHLALVLCAAPVVAMALAYLVAKPLLGRNYEGAPESPSGHITVAAAVASLALLLLFRWNGRRELVRWGPLVVALTFALGVALIRLHAHVLTDVVGGVALGAAVVLGIAAALPERLSAGTPPAATRIGGSR